MRGSEPSPDDRVLAAAALRARARAWAPVTGVRVGAAVRAKDGDVIEGCNVEHPVPHEGACAEKVALYAAVAAGHRQFTAIAVASELDPPATPCGSCRQTLQHWGVDRIVVAHADGRTTVYELGDLLPLAFGWRPDEAPSDG